GAAEVEGGFEMVMWSAGRSAPRRNPRLRSTLPRGAKAAAIAAGLATAAGILITLVPGISHAAIYAVLIASSSAAIVVPIIQERRLAGEDILALITQVTLADIFATLAIPF